MFLRQSLKRTRQEFEQTKKALTQATETLRIEELRSNVREFRRREGERLDCKMIDAAVKGFRNELHPETLVGGGMVSSSTKYPPEAYQMIRNPSRQRNLGYSQGLFWLYSNNQLLLWTATQPTLNSSKLTWTWTQKLSFDEDITCFSTGKVNNIGLGIRPDCQIIVVAVVTTLHLFLYDGQKIIDLNISFIIPERLEKILIAKNGNIYLADMGGRVKALMNIPFKQKITFKEKDSLGFFARLQKLFSFRRPRTKVLQLLINNDETYLYCLTSEETNRGWLNLRFYQSNRKKISTVRAYEIKDDRIQPAYQINDEKIENRLRSFSRSVNTYFYTMLTTDVEIFRIYTTKDNNLGLVLQSGLMISLKNNNTVEILSIGQPILQTSCNLIYETLKFTTSSNTVIFDSLGQNNISNVNGFIIYTDGTQNTVSNRQYQEECQLAEMENMSKFNNQSERRWLIFHREGVDLLRNYSNADKVFCMLDIAESLLMTTSDSKIMPIFQEMCKNMGLVGFCLALIEIICNERMECKLPREMYCQSLLKVIEMTKKIKKQEPNQEKASEGDITLHNDLKKINKARELLTLFQSLPLKRPVTAYNGLNVFMSGMSFFDLPDTDALWQACLVYFGNIISPILYKSTNFYKKQPGFIATVESKLNDYSNFLADKIRQFKQPSRMFMLPKLPNSKEQIKNLNTDVSMEIEEELRESTRETVFMHNQHFPKNSTYSLLVKISSTVEKIRMLMVVLSNIVYFENCREVEPTIYTLMGSTESLRLLRQRVLKSFPLDHPIFALINKIMPELLTMEHVSLEKWLEEPEKNQSQVGSFLSALDVQAMQHCKEACFKRNLYGTYYEIYMQRLSYLENRRKSLMYLKQEVDQRNKEESKADEFDKIEGEEMNRQVRENEQETSKQRQVLLNDIENLIKLNKKEAPQPEDIRKLDASLTSVYSSNDAYVLQKCLQITQRTMMIPQVRYLRSHPVLQTTFPI